MTFEVPTGGSYEWQINNSPQMKLDLNHLDLDGNGIIDVLDIEFDDVSNTITADATGMTLNTTTAGDAIIFKSAADLTVEVNDFFLRITNVSESQDPQIVFHMDDASPVDTTTIGRIIFDGEDTSSVKVSYAKIIARAEDVSATSRDGRLELSVASAESVAGTTDNAIVIQGGGTLTLPEIGFFGKEPVARPSGVAVNATAIHAALVSLGLITA